MNVAITGATGLVGNNLVRQLLDQGAQVRVVVRPTSDPRCLDDCQVDEIVTGFLDDAETLERFLAPADAVVHAAGYIWFGRTHLDLSRRVNVELTRHVARKARELGIRMIHVSSVDALAASPTPDKVCNELDLEPPKAAGSYTISKREAEQVVMDEVEQGLDAVIVNPSLMLGPWDWKPSSGQMLQAVIRGFVPLAPGGGTSVADVRHVVQAIILAIERGRTGERYILAGDNLTYIDLWKRFAAKAGKRWPRWGMPDPMAKAVGWFGDMASWVTRRETEVNSPALQLSQQFSYYSSDKARDELDYRTSDLQTAIDDAYDWLQQHDYL